MENTQVWTTKLGNGDTVAVIVNWNDLISDTNYKFKLSDIGVVPTHGKTIKVRNLFDHKDIATLLDPLDTTEVLVEDLPPRGSQIYQFSEVKNEEIEEEKFLVIQ